MNEDLINKVLAFQNHDQIKINPEPTHCFSILLVSLIVFLLFCPYKKNNRSRELLDKQTATAIKGFAIFQIIIGHLNYYVLEPRINLGGLSEYGVSTFLFLSGYGLYESFKRNGLKTFFEKRFLRVYIPFFIANVLLIFLDYLLLGKSLGSYYSYILYTIGYKTSTGNFWFIHYLFLWYFMFYVSFAFCETKNKKILMLFLCSIIPFLFVSHQNYWEALPVFLFPFGVFIAAYKDRIEIFFNKFHNKNILRKVAVFVLFLVCYKYFVNPSVPKIAIISTLALSIHKVIITSVCVSTFLIIFRERLSVFFLFIGNISFELYLLHGSFMYSYDFIMYKFPVIWSFYFYLFFIIFLSYVLKKISSNVSFKISKFI